MNCVFVASHDLVVAALFLWFTSKNRPEGLVEQAAGFGCMSGDA